MYGPADFDSRDAAPRFPSLFIVGYRRQPMTVDHSKSRLSIARNRHEIGNFIINPNALSLSLALSLFHRPSSFIIFRLSHTPIYISQVLVSRVLSESESTWTKTRRKIVSIQQNADPVTGDANTEHRAPDTGISGKGDCDSGINYTWG